MRLSKKLLLIVVLAIAAAGLGYLIFGLVYVPDLAQFRVTAELARTEYHAGESITVEPFLTYAGMRRVTIISGIPLLFVDVYTAEDARVFELPVLTMTPDIALRHTLRPDVPFSDKDRWRDLPVVPAGYLEVYTFSVEQPGSYYVVVRAEFWLDKDGLASPSRVYSEPIWIQVTV